MFDHGLANKVDMQQRAFDSNWLTKETFEPMPGALVQYETLPAQWHHIITFAL
jgi:hypothetical protein